jgi:hypothetical protein
MATFGPALAPARAERGLSVRFELSEQTRQAVENKLMSEILGQSGYALPTLGPPVCVN